MQVGANLKLEIMYKFTKKTQNLINGKWVTENKEKSIVDSKFRRLYSSPRTLELLRDLGGLETVEEKYINGVHYLINISISPTRDFRYVATFKEISEEKL